MRPERDAALVTDILGAAAEVSQFLRGIDRERFETDALRRRAVERACEIIGEAAGRLSAEFQAAHPEVPWRKVRALRNVLAHDYASVDVRALYRIATQDVPELERTLSKQAPG